MRIYLQLHSFLISIPDGCKLQASVPVTLLLEKETPVDPTRQSGSERKEEKIPVPAVNRTLVKYVQQSVMVNAPRDSHSCLQ